MTIEDIRTMEDKIAIELADKLGKPRPKLSAAPATTTTVAAPPVTPVSAEPATPQQHTFGGLEDLPESDGVEDKA